MLGQDRPDSPQEAFERLLPVLLLAGAVGVVALMSRPGGALSGLGQEDDIVDALDRAEAALEAVDRCRPGALTALQVAERELGRASTMASDLEAPEQRAARSRISRLNRDTNRANRVLTRCITG
jgi:hypothetical protein